ncbi:hypothetical protein CSAL01_12906 [Colletotrichum salicis]|uniref:Uncharacterized protein n=1 Tax=Colletotrichum salicis TaxID=1209931 RepID=A0A135UHC6_9PEZI|nr:hypothetical protein CSAL01_12906 [Colletotrichum salicis]
MLVAATEPKHDSLDDSVKNYDRPAVSAQDLIRSAYDDGTEIRSRVLEQLAMEIQDNYQSAIMATLLRRPARILLHFQLSSKTPSISVSQSVFQ